jgi:hypothetical protein
LNESEKQVTARNFQSFKYSLFLNSFSQNMAEPQIAENGQGQQRPAPSPFQRCLDCLRAPRQHQLRYLNHACDSLVRSVFWKTLIIFCTVLLLFGSPIQFLWVPKGGDSVFDVLYIIALVVFLHDMLFNLISDPEYFGFDPWRPNRMQQPYQQKFWTCGIGSFIFWCDVVSTAALCHDISYINPREYAMVEITLDLDEYGILVSIRSSM